MIEETPRSDGPETMATEPVGATTPRFSDTAIAAALGIVSLIVYVITLCPTIFTDDCGEIATAVATGGVMHPPGYPLYTLLGRLFVKFVPWGEPAHRLGLLSCVCGAAAVAATYSLARRCGAGQAWAATGALTFAFSYTLWQQSTKVETYSLNALFVAILLGFAVRVRQTGSVATFAAMAFCGGLALTNHLTIVWLIPTLAYLSVPKLSSTLGPGKALGAVALAVVMCLLPLPLYLTEIVSARAHPGGQVWGDTSTWHRFWLHVTGARYHGKFGIPSLSFLYGRDVLFMPGWLWRNMGVMVLFAVVGGAKLIRDPQARPIGIGLILGVVAYLTCNTVYRILNIFEYYTSTVLMLSVLAAIGGEYVAKATTNRILVPGRERFPRVLESSVIALLCLTPIISNWQACDRSAADDMRVMAENGLNMVEPNSLIVANGDNITFGLWYTQEVLGERRDVIVLPRSLMEDWKSPLRWDMSRWALRRVHREHPDVDVEAVGGQFVSNPSLSKTRSPLGDVVSAAIKAGRTVYFTDALPGDMTKAVAGQPEAATLTYVPGYTLIYNGILQRTVKASQPKNPKTRLQAELVTESKIKYQYATPILFADEPDGDLPNKKYAGSLTTMAQILLDCEDLPGAFERAHRAYLLNSESARVVGTYAYTCAVTGRADEAIGAWQEAISLDPTNAEYKHDLAVATDRRDAAKAGP